VPPGQTDNYETNNGFSRLIRFHSCQCHLIESTLVFIEICIWAGNESTCTKEGNSHCVCHSQSVSAHRADFVSKTHFMPNRYFAAFP
jgi:hypothetical protein